MLEQFDYPDPTMPTGSRNATVVSPQALLMMNSPVVMDAADKLAAKLLADAKLNDSQRIEHAYNLAYSRPALPQEIKRALSYLETLRKDFATKSSDASAGRNQAWSLFCQTLLAGNEFIYLR